MGYGYDRTCRCVLCGDTVYNGEPFYSDGLGAIHLDCEEVFLGLMGGGGDDE